MAKQPQSHMRHAYSSHNPADYATPQDYEGSLTDQSQAQDCDINNILARHQITGVYDHVAKYHPWYGEATGEDFYQAMNLIAQAESMFEELPSEARASFENDPAKFLDFVRQDLSTPENLERLCELNMVEPGTETYNAFVQGQAKLAQPDPTIEPVAPPMVPDPTPPSE